MTLFNFFVRFFKSEPEELNCYEGVGYEAHKLAIKHFGDCSVCGRSRE
jgi:hypothetical protein